MSWRFVALCQNRETVSAMFFQLIIHKARTSRNPGSDVCPAPYGLQLVTCGRSANSDNERSPNKKPNPVRSQALCGRFSSSGTGLV
jgi:hypothetical protein